ncbi:DUF1735 domain-containing protein [Mucilaginibacter sp. McL0603]|uniref:DUF1735 domain-containing protein n=1 Tax=Mucilaginibacter sp. McL0603 TaxID=3415670 RepID=UPI003CED35CD
MKAKYIKRIMALSISALLFSSCLKDSARVFNPEATTPNVVQFFNSNMQNFGHDAVTGSGLDTITFAVGVTAANPPSAATTVTIGVDNTLVTTINGINYIPIPADAYVLPTKVTIPAGKNNATTTVIINITKLDPTLSYLLPVKIVSSTPSLPIAANLNVHYFHIIGNDFAGAYLQDFIRTPPGGDFAGTAVTLIPDSPTQIEMPSGYAALGVRYVVNFTKTGSGASATYSNFTVAFNPDDVKSGFTGNGITVINAPAFVSYDATHPYTLTEVTHGLLSFTYSVTNSAGAGRAVVDKYYKP